MDHKPLSPALSKTDALPGGFNDLIQHNSTAHYSQETPMDSIQAHAHSQPTSRYGTPVPQPHRSQGFEQTMQYSQRGGGDQLQGYQPMHLNDNSPYGPVPVPYSTPATSPPTPSRGSDIITTRSGNTIHRNSGSKTLGPRSSRVEKSVSKKKKEKAKPAKNVPQLTEPMSVVKVDKEIEVADIAAYVNRSSEVRREEVNMGKNPGRVKRPMNAFMLYRKAYQLKAKEWASQHNHQVVSRVCGMSWPLEPEETREQFKTWAEMERDNHQKAHPDYKFTPSKPHKPKYNAGKLDHSDGSDLDDYGNAWATGARAGSQIRSNTRTPNEDYDDEYYNSRSIYGGSGGGGGGMHHPVDMYGMSLQPHDRSTFSFSNPGRPVPTQYDHRDLPAAHSYYDAQQHVRSAPRHLPQVEDILIHPPQKPLSPSLAFQQGGSGSGHGGYLAQQYHGYTSIEQPQRYDHHHHHQHRIDPSLISHDGGLLDAGGGNFNMFFDNSTIGSHLEQPWQTTATQQASTATGGGGDGEGQYGQGLFGGPEDLMSPDQLHILKGSANEWHREELSETEQFDMSWADFTPKKTEP
ncbi:hypothetical protein B0T17DRAFT_631160 [Bombardia bombarda]|uniref:HMG box domain-containing protein n=1 Tax=Bombardia bombarda TaxID=252184 RepID=A0AA39X735_9PEZI|nr:hypothetical protein B0T17DRAFT_631160 [Bombardia bombarda]